MDDANLAADVIDIVRVIGRIGQDVTLEPETRLDEDLNLDSLAQVEVILKIEDTFHVTIDEDQAERLKTIGDLTSYVHRQKIAAA